MQWDEAHALVGAFLKYNDNTADRKLFYQALDAVLAIHLDDELEINDYTSNLRQMFGDGRIDAVLGFIDGSVRFYGLMLTNVTLEGLDRHQRLLDSYTKLQAARGKTVR